MTTGERSLSLHITVTVETGLFILSRWLCVRGLLGLALGDLSAWGDHPALHTGGQNLCAVRVCRAASSPAGNSSSVGHALTPRCYGGDPPAPPPTACELHVWNVSFLIQDGWEFLSPQHTSYKSTHFSYRYSGKWS